MYPPFWHYLTDESQNTSQLFAVVGKILYVATRYESHCRSLRTLLDVREAVAERKVDLSDYDSTERLVESIKHRRLNDHIQRICKSLGIETPFGQILMAAKNSRNYIAHEMTLGLEAEVEFDEAFFEKTHGELSSHSPAILRAESLVIRIIAERTHEELPLPAYISNNQRWIFLGTQTQWT